MHVCSFFVTFLFSGSHVACTFDQTNIARLIVNSDCSTAADSDSCFSVAVWLDWFRYFLTSSMLYSFTDIFTPHHYDLQWISIKTAPHWDHTLRRIEIILCKLCYVLVKTILLICCLSHSVKYVTPTVQIAIDVCVDSRPYVKLYEHWSVLGHWIPKSSSKQDVHFLW